MKFRKAQNIQFVKTKGKARKALDREKSENSRRRKSTSATLVKMKDKSFPLQLYALYKTEKVK